MSKETLQWLNTMVLVGQTDKRGHNAWHYRASEQGEPNHYAGAIPISEVRRRLFSWSALQLPIAVAQPATVETMNGLDDDGHPVRFTTIPGRKAIAASDNFDVLGVFRSGYQPHDYEAWLLNNVATLLDSELEISSAGLLKGRAVGWVEIGVPDSITTPEGVQFRPNLLAATSLDGSLATVYKRTITATICDNTMTAALAEGGKQLKFRHSRNSIARIADARVALDIVYSAADDFAAEVHALTSQVVTDKQWSDILTQLVPTDSDSKRSATLAQTKREQLTHLYRSDERVTPWTGTAFGVLQAFNTHAQHLSTIKGDTIRAERNMLHALDGTTEAQDRLVLAVLGAAGPDFSAGLVP